METKEAKFDWSRIETENKDHNKDEWGTTQNQQEKPRIIHSYKVKWE